MKTLSKEILAQSKNFIWSNCNKLTQTLFSHYLEQENSPDVITALTAYQNDDGGFGHNLEGDFELPLSSPMATSVGFQILTAVNTPASAPIIQKAITYILSTYQPSRKGWITVPPEVNNYPHADWWHFQESEGGTVIDHSWGNPTAELVGYLHKFRQLVPTPLLDDLTQFTLSYLRDFPEIMDMHELYCFLRFAQNIPSAEFQIVREKLIHFVLNIVAADPTKWQTYTAQPLDFVHEPDSFLHEPLKSAVTANLDYWIDHINSDGTWHPTWNWKNYPAAWEDAKIQISGRMTVARLKILKNFNRLEQ